MRAEKQFLLDEIQEKIEASTGFVVVRYQGITANKTKEFRDQVDQTQGEFEVVRKRVFIKALEKHGINFNVNDLQGHVGVIFAKKDVSALTKMAVKYSEANDKCLEVLGGKVENDVYSAQEMIALSTLPGIEEMRSMFLAVLEAPMRDVVSVQNAHLTSLLYCLDEKAKKEQ